MNFKELGATGVRLPEIGLGTWQYRAGVEPLQKGIVLGATLIDTAEMYGTEAVVGEAIQGRRQDVFIATKVSGSHLRYDDVLRAADASLKRLGIESIDLYQVHWPNPSTPIRETMRAMGQLADDGRVKYIGLSNFSAAQTQEAQEALPNHRIVSNQVPYSLFNREIERELVPYCERNKITVIAYSPLERGQLTSRPLFKRRRALSLLQRIATETEKTTAQVALNWCIAKSSVIAIPKADRIDHVAENCAASGWKLSDKHLKDLDDAFA